MGCGPTVGLDPDTSGGSGAVASSGQGSTGAPVPPPMTSTTSTSGPPVGTFGTTATDPDSSESGGSFIEDPDGGGPCFCCDVWAQDCPPGDKCAAWDNSGGDEWNGTRCSPIARNPGQPGDPCTVESGPASGLDDCDIGAMCWDVDPRSLAGQCVALCTGNNSDPLCEDPQTDCLIADVLNLCLLACDPLILDCAAGESCVPSETGFVCVPEAIGDGADVGETCDQVFDCQPGLLCRSAMTVGPICAQDGGQCCTPYCDLSEPNPASVCPDPRHVCTPWPGSGQGPGGPGPTGFCALAAP